MSIPDRLAAALAEQYALEGELGQGGMATVYLAEDLKHDRKVAVKVLKPELAAVVGAERFLAEIRTTAKLQHPHILPLHDSGEADGFLFYVMPYVGGESLREKLDREKQLRVEEALDYARKIGDALDYAHEQGVVHRDIKPANVLLSERGEPLVADFGIALAVSQAGDGRITETGLSLGTPHYMSPEQASGDRDVDPRSDVYALGCVMYEMLAGQPPFAAPTAQAVLARILTETPRRVTEARRTVPPHVASVIAKSLEKLPADRFSSVRELLDALGREDFAYAAEPAAGTGGHQPLARPSTPDPRRLASLLAVALVVTAGLAVSGWLRGGGGGDASNVLVQRASVETPPDFEWTTGPMRIAPDDEHLMVVGESGVWIRAIAEREFRLLPETESVSDARFSSDGRELVLLGGGEITRAALDGSNRRLVAVDSDAVQAPVWGDDGYGYFLRSSTIGSDVARVLMSGTDSVESIAPPAGLPVFYTSLEPLPGGRAVLVSGVNLAVDAYDTYVIDLADGGRTLLLPDAGYPTWVGSSGPLEGHLVFIDSRGGLRAVPFDPSTATALGLPVQLERGVSVPTHGSGRLSISRRGTLVYSEGGVFSTSEAMGERGELLEVGFDGDTTVLRSGDFVLGPTWSPDGRYVAYAAGSSVLDLELFIYDTQLALPPRQVATEVPWVGGGVWSPDGQSLAAFGGEDLGSASIQLVDAFGVQSRSAATFESETQGIFVPAQWTETGIVAVLQNVEPGGIYVQADTSEAPRPWYTGNVNSARVAPQGDYIAYTESSGVYARAFPEIGPPIPLVSGGFEPIWSPDGDEILYTTSNAGERQLRRARISRDPTLTVVGDELVMPIGNNSGWDIHPSGDRVVIASIVEVGSEGGEPAGDLDVPDRTWIVFNWFEELRDAFAEEEGR